MNYKRMISVIMPCFNVEDYIREAIQSIIDQTFTDWELIIVDDGSIDGTKSIIKSFDDERIRLFTFKNNKGNYVARNFGLNQAIGKYIAMMDADDISLPSRLRVQYDYLQKFKSVGAIGSNFMFVNDKGEEMRKSIRTCNFRDFKVELLRNCYMLQSTFFLRSSILKKYCIKYDCRYKYASDYHFIFQCSKYFKIYNISDCLLKYRVNPNSITTQKYLEQQKFASQIRRKIFNFYFGKIISPIKIKYLDDFFNDNSEVKIEIEEILKILNFIINFNNENRFFQKKALYNLFLKQLIKIRFSNRLLVKI